MTMVILIYSKVTVLLISKVEVHKPNITAIELYDTYNCIRQCSIEVGTKL